MLGSLDLRLLQPLVVLARELHYGRAAAALALSQPAVSQQIQRLETQLSITLFERSPTGVAITPQGQRLARVAEDALVALQGAIAEITEDTAATPLRLAHTPLAWRTAALLHAAAAEAGALGVVTTAWESDLMAELRMGRTAIAVGHGLPDQPEVEVRRVHSELLHVVAGGIDAEAGAVHLLDLADRSLLLGPLDLQPAWRSFLLDHVADAIGPRPKVRTVPVSMTGWQAALPTALDCDTFLLLPESSVPPGVPSVPVAPAIDVPLSIAWPATSIRPDMRLALDRLRDAWVRM